MHLTRNLIKILNHLLILAVSFLAISCEEVIKIELKTSSPLLVAEGMIQQDSTAWIKLSYTSDYFTSGETEYVGNASVRLTDNMGNSEIFSYKENGLYKGSSIKGKASRLYIINITGPDFNYYASSNLFAPSKIYSLGFESRDIYYPGEVKKLYTATIKFHDDPLTENYYMIKFWKNGEPDDNGYTLLKDSYYSSGDTIEYSAWRNSFELGENIIVRLFSIDQKSYNYYNQLNDLLDSGMGGSSTPYNPQSNFGPGVLGHFGASSFASATAVVK